VFDEVISGLEGKDWIEIIKKKHVKVENS